MSTARTYLGSTLAALEGVTYGASPMPRVEAASPEFDLSIGEVWFDLPPTVRGELGAALSGMARIGYSDPAGERALRETYLEQLSPSAAASGPAADRDVLVTAGGKEGLWLAVNLAIELGSPRCVLVPRPGWAPYAVWARAGGCAALGYDPAALARGAEELDAAVRRAEVRPGLLILNYPHNPTGTAVSQGRMNELMECAAGHGIRVVSDEVYRAFSPDGASAALAPSFDPARDVVVDSCSKWLGAAGLRVGFVVAGPEILRPLAAFRATYASCTGIAAQMLAAELLRSGNARTWLKSVRADIESTRAAAVDELEVAGVSVASHGGLYIWAHKAVRPTAVDRNAPRAKLTDGAEFGCADRVRVCVAREGLDPRRAARAVRASLGGDRLV